MKKKRVCGKASVNILKLYLSLYKKRNNNQTISSSKPNQIPSTPVSEWCHIQVSDSDIRIIPHSGIRIRYQNYAASRYQNPISDLYHIRVSESDIRIMPHPGIRIRYQNYTTPSSTGVSKLHHSHFNSSIRIISCPGITIRYQKYTTLR